MDKKIYLDNAATTRVHDDVIKEMIPYFSEIYGNASSLHSMGQKSRNTIENARVRIAKCIGCKPEEIIFTAGGTESDNIAILGTARRLKSKGNHIITSNIEHPAVRNTIRHLEKEDFKITELPVSSQGLISIESVKEAIRKDTILISIMYANNEVGTIQPVEEIANIAEERGIIFHTDAVQAFGKIRMNLANSNIHLLSASSHKIMGPKGIGLLFIRNKGKHPKLGNFIEPIMFGGGHEAGLRSSTENIPGIIGFAKAIEIVHYDLEEEWERERKLRDNFIEWTISNISNSFLNGAQNPRLANNINLGFKYIEGESLLLLLNEENFEVSTGSACSSKSLEPSHVLLALGIDRENIRGSLRITLGRDTIPEDLDKLKPILKTAIEKLRRLSPLTPH